MVKELNPKKLTLEGGLNIEYFEAGTGSPLIVFGSNDEEPDSPLLSTLSKSHRIIAVNPAGFDSTSANQLSSNLPRLLTEMSIEQCSVMGISEGARPALALSIAAGEHIDKLILLSPRDVLDAGESLNLAAVKSPTLVLVGTHDASATIEGRHCREKIPSCHLSFVYGAGHEPISDRLNVWLDTIAQFLKEGEQFIIFRDSQLIRA
jgi:pimeloyl-ACP methyl ester carboxylesterase